MKAIMIKHVSIPTLIIGLVIGGLLTAGIMTIAKPETAVAPDAEDLHVADNSTDENNMARNDMATMSMDDMNASLATKSGDDFDKAFIDLMIEHHQGAIEMAELATTKAKHQEIKKLSLDIISAQQAEITTMKEWSQAWGY